MSQSLAYLTMELASIYEQYTDFLSDVIDRAGYNNKSNYEVE